MPASREDDGCSIDVIHSDLWSGMSCLSCSAGQMVLFYLLVRKEHLTSLEICNLGVSKADSDKVGSFHAITLVLSALVSVKQGLAVYYVL